MDGLWKVAGSLECRLIGYQNQASADGNFSFNGSGWLIRWTVSVWAEYKNFRKGTFRGVMIEINLQMMILERPIYSVSKNGPNRIDQGQGSV